MSIPLSYNLRNLRVRWRSTLATMVGIALVVTVFIFVRALAHGCSKLFQVAIQARRFLYNVRILRDSTLGVQVIAIGNLTVGGTGKTPVVEKFARELHMEDAVVAACERNLHVWEHYLNGIAAAGDGGTGTGTRR